MTFVVRTAAGILRLLTAAAFLAPFAAMAAGECRDDLDEADGYTIRSIEIEGRWVPAMALPIKPGDRFSNAKVQEAMRAVQAVLQSGDRQQFELQNVGAVGVLHITRCLIVEGREVDVVIQPHSLRVDLFEVGGNILPIPRAPFATFYEAVPEAILKFHPLLGVYQDKTYGVASTASIDAHLLDQVANARGQSTQLDLAASGRKSFEHSFYNADAGLNLASLQPGHLFERLSLNARYSGQEEPQAGHSYERQAGEVGISARLRPGTGLIQTLMLGGHYQFSGNRFDDGGERTNTTEHKAQLLALLDGRAGDAFVRAAVWGEAAWPDRGSSYGRIAALAAVEKEFLIAPNQTIGVEAALGGGKTWSAPGYAEFYGGNSDRDFLYESLDSSTLAAFPNGPTIRSFGEGQAFGRSGDGRGSTRYWHLNLNISLPIPQLSAPLIPNEEVLPGVTLKRLLKNKASDSVAYYAVQLESEGLSPAEALAQARAMYGEVRPAIEFIADCANVYSLKPLVLFDLAGQDGNGKGERIQSAFGGGLQLTIVTARMEAGYMQTLTGGDSGNFFARIVFQNIF